MKSENYIITPPKLFSGFALGNNSIYLVACVRYQIEEIISSHSLFVSYGLASRRYYLLHKKLYNSCLSKSTLMFLTCQIKT